MVEGGGSKDFRKIKKLLFSQPKVLHQLLDKLAQAVIYYLNAQIDAGVQLVQIFDTWGGALGPQTYREFSLAYMEQIIAGLTRNRLWGQVPCIVFTKQSGLWLEAIAQSGCDAIGLDWAISIADAKRRVGQQVALQGNMDPAVLYASPNRIRQEVGDILSQFGPGPGHVFNLGHGIPMDVPPDNVSVLVEAVHQLSKPYHQTKE
jgi:uroporphyrinogen decarboxylase